MESADAADANSEPQQLDAEPSEALEAQPVLRSEQLNPETDGAQQDSAGPVPEDADAQQESQEPDEEDVFAADGGNLLNPDALQQTAADGDMQQNLLDSAVAASGMDDPASTSYQQIMEEAAPATSSPDPRASISEEYDVARVQSIRMTDDLPGIAAEEMASAIVADEAPTAYVAALSNSEMDPDHPLLARAQNALGKQLLAIKYRLESEVREKAVALQVIHAPLPTRAVSLVHQNPAKLDSLPCVEALCMCPSDKLYSSMSLLMQYVYRLSKIQA